MTSSIEEMRDTSLTFRQTLLKSEKKRIVAVIAFVAFFAVLATVRIFVLGSAMSPWGIIVALVLITFELGLLYAVNRALRSDKDIPTSVWYVSTALESLFPSVGVALTVAGKLLPAYRPVATPWVLAYFPFILLSVLRLKPKLCWFSGVVAALGYLASAYITGWRFAAGPDAAPHTAVLYYAFVLVATGFLAAGVAAEIRTHADAALREAETQHQLRQVAHELQIARSIQQSLLPKVRPQISGYQVSGWSRSADDTGGDFYDWKRLPDGRWVVVLADVTGHGIGPAILASVCRAYSRANFSIRDSLETTLKNINLSFAEDLTPERFATFVAVVCTETSNELELLSAGHGPIFTYSSENQTVSLLEAQALPLGVLPDLWQAEPLKIRMQPGDLIILITDGFFEWENNGGEQFGSDRLAAIVRQFSNEDPEVIIAELYDSVLKFAQGTPQQDDLTAVLIKRSPNETPSYATPTQQETIAYFPDASVAVGDNTAYEISNPNRNEVAAKNERACY